MRRGLRRAGHLLVGLLLLSAGIAVTVTSEKIVWYGAIVVGMVEIVRGLSAMADRDRGLDVDTDA